MKNLNLHRSILYFRTTLHTQSWYNAVKKRIRTKMSKLCSFYVLFLTLQKNYKTMVLLSISLKEQRIGKYSLTCLTIIKRKYVYIYSFQWVFPPTTKWIYYIYAIWIRLKRLQIYISHWKNLRTIFFTWEWKQKQIFFKFLAI